MVPGVCPFSLQDVTILDARQLTGTSLRDTIPVLVVGITVVRPKFKSPDEENIS